MTDLYEIKDPVVAVYLTKMEGKLEALKVSNENIEKQLDYVMQELREVVRMSSRLPDHDESVKQIWQELGVRDKLWHDRLDSVATELGETKDKVNKIFWFGAGFSFVGSALMALVVWLILGELSDSQNMAERIRDMEVYLSGPREQPFEIR